MLRFKATLAASFLTIAALAAVPVSAVTLHVKYEPITDTNEPFSFHIDSNPMPLENEEGAGFIAAITNGTGLYADLSSITFFSSDEGGAFDSYYGPQLYIGSEQAPSLLAGSFDILFEDLSDQTGTLTIGELAGAVPEPATWAMMLVGFGAVGTGLRRRKGQIDRALVTV